MPTTTLTPISSQGTTLAIKVASTYTQVKGFTDFSGIGSGSATIIDISDLSSTGRQKLLGLADEGNIKVTLNYIPDDAGQLAVAAARVNRATSNYQIALPDGTTFTFDALCQSFDIGGKVDDKVQASVALEITGLVTRTKV